MCGNPERGISTSDNRQSNVNKLKFNMGVIMSDAIYILCILFTTFFPRCCRNSKPLKQYRTLLQTGVPQHGFLSKRDSCIFITIHEDGFVIVAYERMRTVSFNSRGHQCNSLAFGRSGRLGLCFLQLTLSFIISPVIPHSYTDNHLTSVGDLSILTNFYLFRFFFI